MTEYQNISSDDYLSATICHGTLGVANIFHLFHKHFWADDVMASASKYWYKKSIDILNSEINYKYNNQDNEYVYKNGILYGVEGIGLALLSKIDKNSSDWNTFLLLK